MFTPAGNLKSRTRSAIKRFILAHSKVSEAIIHVSESISTSATYFIYARKLLSYILIIDYA